jgi:hypothetical protein
MSEWLAQLQQLVIERAAVLRRLMPLAIALLAVAIPLKLLEPQAPLFLSAPRPFLLAWPVMPSASTQPIQTANGTVIYVPVTGDQCWLAPLPCTPHLESHLQVIRLSDSRLIFANTLEASK